MWCWKQIEFYEEMASLLMCKHLPLPFKFLGLPLGASPRLKKTWHPEIDKFKRKLAPWKKRFSPLGGELF